MDCSELRRLAEAATGGRWVTDGEYVNEHGNLTYAYVAHEDGGRIAEALANCLVKTDEQCRTNAAFIAAANPAAVLALIAEIDGLREEVEIDNKIIAERDRLLNAVPECAAHGQCVPHAIQWVKDVQVENSQLLEERDQLKAENERLQQFEAAYTEWSNKTDWVQETVHWSELGMHRADVLQKRCRDGAFHQQAQADRIKTLMAQVETLTSQVKALQSDANSYQSGYDAGRAAAKAHADSWRAEAEALRKDAERYRWVRVKQTFIWLIQDWFPKDNVLTDVDAEIDAAMSKEAGHEGIRP